MTLAVECDVKQQINKFRVAEVPTNDTGGDRFIVFSEWCALHCLASGINQ